MEERPASDVLPPSGEPQDDGLDNVSGDGAPGDGVSRRGFLRGLGGSLAATALGGGLLTADRRCGGKRRREKAPARRTPRPGWRRSR